eukprot:symbB.v1.2.041453.t1/scaffold8217.1/size9214/1
MQQLMPQHLVKTQSAVAETREMVNKVKGLLEDLAARHTGDMQTHLAFHRHRFREDADGTFGLLTDLTLAGGPRFAFVGAHFPISRLAAILETEDAAQKLASISSRVSMMKWYC